MEIGVQKNLERWLSEIVDQLCLSLQPGPDCNPSKSFQIINNLLINISDALAKEIKALSEKSTSPEEEELYLHCGEIIESIYTTIEIHLKEGTFVAMPLPYLPTILNYLEDLSLCFSSLENAQILQALTSKYAIEEMVESLSQLPSTAPPPPTINRNPIYNARMGDALIRFEVPPMLPPDITSGVMAEHLLAHQDDPDIRKRFYPIIKKTLLQQANQTIFQELHAPINERIKAETQYRNAIIFHMERYNFPTHSNEGLTPEEHQDEFIYTLEEMEKCCKDTTFDYKTTDAEIPHTQLITIARTPMEARVNYGKIIKSDLAYLQNLKEAMESVRNKPEIIQAEEYVKLFCISTDVFVAYTEALRMTQARYALESIELYAEIENRTLYVWQPIFNEQNQRTGELILRSRSEPSTLKPLDVLYLDDDNFFILNEVSIPEYELAYESYVKTSGNLHQNLMSLSKLQEVNERWQGIHICPDSPAGVAAASTEEPSMADLLSSTTSELPSPLSSSSVTTRDDQTPTKRVQWSAALFSPSANATPALGEVVKPASILKRNIA